MTEQKREIITGSTKETQKLAADLTESLGGNNSTLALSGELGSGKTTFIQGLAKTLGIRDNVLSPTFVLMKKYIIKEDGSFKNFYHFDCYRVESSGEILDLGFREIIKDKSNLVVIEWAEKIKDILPSDTTWLNFSHRGGEKRLITIEHEITKET